MRNVTIRNNVITRTGQSGIRIEGSRIIVENNRLTDAGGGGIPGFVLAATDSQITNNTFTYSGNGPVDNTMVILPGSMRNVYQNNRGFVMSGNAR
jgi:parallel beta-helix repeat protein